MFQIEVTQNAAGAWDVKWRRALDGDIETVEWSEPRHVAADLDLDDAIQEATTAAITSLAADAEQ